MPCFPFMPTFKAQFGSRASRAVASEHKKAMEDENAVCLFDVWGGLYPLGAIALPQGKPLMCIPSPPCPFLASLQSFYISSTLGEISSLQETHGRIDRGGGEPCSCVFSGDLDEYSAK